MRKPSIQWVPGYFPKMCSRLWVQLIAYLHLTPRSWMRGGILCFGTWYSIELPSPLLSIAEFRALQIMGEQNAKLCKKPKPLLGFLIMQGYYKWFIRFQDAIFSKPLHVQTWLIYEKNCKLTKFYLSATVGSTSWVPLQNRDKTRKLFLCVWICEMFVCYSGATRIQNRVRKRTAM
jgi:hypothetical protein